MPEKRFFRQGLLLASLTLLFDQASKEWMVGLFRDGHPPIEILPFFDLVMVWNTGISFGMLAARHQPVLLVSGSVVIVGILLIWLYKNTSLRAACALGLVIGGAVGNIIDRVRFGAVADFFDAHVGPYHWPAFNIADSAIFIGVVLLCAGSMFTRDESDNEGNHS